MTPPAAPGKDKANEKPKVIRVKRRGKKEHHAHTGSWKVAYADFVTAMMAFFMVMWILGMDAKTRDAIEGYFSNPVGFKKGFGLGAKILANGNIPAGENRTPLKANYRMNEEQQFARLANNIRNKLQGLDQLRLLGAKVETIQSKAGLRIELIESGSGQTFFPNGSAVMNPVTEIALQMIGEELKQLRAPIILEGHTDAHAFGEHAGYTNWELSSDRANAARRMLERSGIDPQRIVEVRGMADREPRMPENPLDPSNRRISILLPFTTPENIAQPEDQLGPDASVIHSVI